MSIYGTNCFPGFQNSPLDSGRCIPDCPTQQGFELQVKNGVPACVYKTKPDVYFTLKSGTAFNAGMIQELRTLDELERVYGKADWASAMLNDYRTAKEAYTNDSAIALAQVDKEKQVSDAFAALQTAENARDSAPQAYQEARVRYYTLLNGEEWLTEERDRILKAEAKPKADTYLASYTDLTTRRQQQQQTMDVMNAVKDKVLSMKDDFQMTTNVFSKQIADLKNQIQLESKAKATTTSTLMGWMDSLLNIVLILILVVAAFVIGRSLLTKPSSTYTSPTPLK